MSQEDSAAGVSVATAQDSFTGPSGDDRCTAFTSACLRLIWGNRVLLGAIDDSALHGRDMAYREELQMMAVAPATTNLNRKPPCQTPSLRAASAAVELSNIHKARSSYACTLGFRSSYHAHRCIVVGWTVQQGHRYRMGWISRIAGTSSSDSWRRRTTASNPCRSRTSHPQRQY